MVTSDIPRTVIFIVLNYFFNTVSVEIIAEHDSLGYRTSIGQKTR